MTPAGGVSVPSLHGGAARLRKPEHRYVLQPVLLVGLRQRSLHQIHRAVLHKVDVVLGSSQNTFRPPCMVVLDCVRSPDSPDRAAAS